MTPDDATLAAYADGELGSIEAARVERALAADPALAARVACERALRERLSGAFATVMAEPVPAGLGDRLASNVVPWRPRSSLLGDWPVAAAIAATVVLGLGIDRRLREAPASASPARAALVAALDHDLSGGTGPTRLLASFRSTDGGYCRLFETEATGGIACRAGQGWQVRRVEAIPPRAATGYARAGSSASALMAAAQDMMAGDALDQSAERAARDRGWR